MKEKECGRIRRSKVNEVEGVRRRRRQEEEKEKGDWDK